MPREGIFARVLDGGRLRAGDEVVVEELGVGPQPQHGQPLDEVEV
jgi:MOSC domain-containing protein YiiM